MMAETNARREARRRRILENAESRLRKITTGNADKIEDDSPRVECNSFEAETYLKEYNINGIYNINKEAELQDSTRFNDDKHESFLNDTSDKHGSFLNDTSDKYENFLNDTSDRSTCLSEQISQPKFMLHKLLFHRINFILLAGIVNILLVLKLGHLFGQTIIIPYLLLMLGHLYNCKSLLKTQDNNLLFAALILCNIQPKLIYRFKISFAIFSIILKDFGLYMFSFVLIHYIITCCFYYNATRA